jgi:hypothetical protein
MTSLLQTAIQIGPRIQTHPLPKKASQPKLGAFLVLYCKHWLGCLRLAVLVLAVHAAVAADRGRSLGLGTLNYQGFTPYATLAPFTRVSFALAAFAFRRFSIASITR